MSEQPKIPDPNEELRKKLNAEIESGQKQLVKIKQNSLKALGYQGDVSKFNSIEALDALIDEYNSHKPVEVKNEAPVVGEIKVNAGEATFTLPSGDSIVSQPTTVLNDGGESELMHYVDPLHVPKYLNKYHPNSRVNALPPSDEFPWERLIA
jgi:hypothetical protein